MSQSALARSLLSAALLGTLCVTAGMARAGSDAGVRAQTLIDVNPLLSGYEIRVTRADGRLRLEGAVADESDRGLAAALVALAADGAEVDNALRLDAPLPDAPGHLFTGEEDLTTAARLRQILSWQKDAAGLDVEVNVDGGAAHLSGNVGTTSERDRIAALAATTEGVDQVFNYISVDPELIAAIRDRQAAIAKARHSDAWIANRLRRLLQFNTTVNAHSIEVEARDGTLVLSGTVTSSAERSVAEALAEQVPGVTEVDSQLIIERPL
ncbi:MAG: BON domain-containing protein [Thiohalocapsa sp.]|jgi:osmotically-inducible protein OsmY|uniref:BON domain-containing protein n=1 Tax=Thiohalocapsa sp. TaxID=2497641 RepID=UPI0025D85512|nr:BON domain-containing protein [Thiohalocapsa sp.]MCG6940937.1 BON domain-containing protein [Thiohalocapsa sp.]